MYFATSLCQSSSVFYSTHPIRGGDERSERIAMYTSIHTYTISGNDYNDERKRRRSISSDCADDDDDVVSPPTWMNGA